MRLREHLALQTKAHDLAARLEGEDRATVEALRREADENHRALAKVLWALPDEIRDNKL